MVLSRLAAAPTRAESRSDAQDRAVLSARDFWLLLLKQLQLQDPFAVGDTQAMLQQFVAVQAAQTMTELAKGLQHLQALLLLGRTVQVVVDGAVQTGAVVGVTLAGDAPTLSVRVGATQVTVPLSGVSGAWLENLVAADSRSNGGDGTWA